MARKITHYTSHITHHTPVFAVILVGGKGKRLRPLSTDSRPKAFLPITRDGHTMFRITLDRIKKIIPGENIIVVANKLHASLVRKDFPNMDTSNLLLEPVSRNTAPAITLAASSLKKRFGDAIMVVLASDQYIEGEGLYLDSIKNGVGFVKRNLPALLALGIRPTHPEAGLGYIKIQNPKSKIQNKSKIYKAKSFVEKPNPGMAKRFIDDGNYLWNAGAFIFSAGSLLKAVKKFSPEIFNPLSDPDKIRDVYKRLPDISIDYAVMERAGNIYCMECAYGWKDMGSFDALEEVLKKEGLSYASSGLKYDGVL